jgi:CheY-like chemotaxis protein
MQGERKRILLFEDDYDSMGYFKSYLELVMGWYVELTADTGLLERLGQERFDLILIDLMIHHASRNADGRVVQNVHFENVNWKKTGLEFLRRLRNGEFSKEDSSGTSPDVPVIILSAVADDSVSKELEENVRFNGYVEKPFSLEDLQEKIVELLQEKT